MRRCIFAHEPDGGDSRLSIWRDREQFEINLQVNGNAHSLSLSREEFYRMVSIGIATLYDLPGVPGPQKNENDNELGKDVHPYAADSA